MRWRVDDDTSAPYRRIAADLRAAIRIGVLRPGDCVPTMKELAERYTCSEATAHRALTPLTGTEEVIVSRGRRGVVSQKHVDESVRPT